MATLKHDQQGLPSRRVPGGTDFEQGDMICFTPTTSSRADTTMNSRAWTEVELPWESTLSPMLCPASMSLGDHLAIAPPLCDGPVQSNAAISRGHRSTVRLGTYPSMVLEEGSLEYSVVGP